MKRLILCLSFIFSLIFVNSLFAAKAIICEGPYVLCAYAKCIPIPGEKGKALCTCEVKSGYSIGNKNCQAKANTNADGYETLNSRYFPVKHYVCCHNNRSWANCYNAQCLVNPQDKSQAFCTCPMVKNQGDYMYANDACQTDGCETGIISSYVVKDAISDYDSLKGLPNFDKLPTTAPESCSVVGA